MPLLKDDQDIVIASIALTSFAGENRPLSQPCLTNKGKYEEISSF